MSTNQVRDGARPSSPRRKRGWAGLFAAPEFYAERRPGAALGPFERVFEPCVLVLAITLFALGIVQLGLSVAPDWPAADGLVPLCTLAVVVAYFYSARLERATFFWREWLVLLVPFLLVVRFLPYALGRGDLGADLPGWIAQPFSFLDLGFVFAALVLIGAWVTAFYSSQDLFDVRVQGGELSDLPARTIIERAWESDRTRTIDHTTPFRRLIGRFMHGGVVLIVAAALTAANVRQIVSLDSLASLIAVQHPSSALALVDVLAYWVAVLLLMAEAQYVRTRTVWTLDHVPVTPGVAGRWASGGVALVLLGLVAAALAPTEGMLGIADMFQYALAAFFAIASYVIAGFYLLFWLVLLPLRWLLGGGTEAPAPASVLAPPPPPLPAGDGSFFAVLKSLLFWLVFAGFVGYALVVLWRQGTLHRFIPGIGWLGAVAVRAAVALWWALLALLRLAARGTSAIVELVRPGLARGPRARPGWLRDLLPSGDPRRVVVKTYNVVVARATQRGVFRPTGETASEYRLRLRAALPEAASDVDDLTDAFLRARYSRGPIGGEDVGRVRRAWRRIREGLRSTRR